MVETSGALMAEKKKPGRGRPKTSTRDDKTVKLDRAVVMMAEAIARYRGTTVAEVLSEAARPAIGSAYAKMLRDLEGKG